MNDRFAKYVAFCQIFFNITLANEDGIVESIEPGRLNAEFEECIEDSRTHANLTRNIGDSFLSFVERYQQGESYICKAVDMPIMTTTLTTYEIHLNFHQSSIRTNLGQVKKSFNPLVFLAPPSDDTADDDYQSHISSNKNCDMENWLGEAVEKRQGKKKYVFIQGRQSEISDVVTYLANMIAFAKFRVLFDLEVPSSHPTLVQICLEIGKELTVKETRDFFRAHEKSHPYMSHTLVVAISNIFTVMTKGAKNPEALRRMRYTN